MFDISTKTNLDISSAGVPMKLTIAGEYLKDDDGNFVTITLRGRNSREGQAAQRDMVDRTLDLQRRGQMSNAASIDANGVALLVACTVDWSFTEMNGAPFPCTPANAEKFWSDPNFRAFREQADVFVGSEANFTKR